MWAYQPDAKKACRRAQFCTLYPGFTSGRHWEVDMGTSHEWDRGICKEFISPMGKSECLQDLDSGL